MGDCKIGVRFLVETKSFTFCRTPGYSDGHSQSCVQWAKWFFPWDVKQLGRKAHKLPSSNAEVRNVLIFPSPYIRLSSRHGA